MTMRNLLAPVFGDVLTGRLGRGAWLACLLVILTVFLAVSLGLGLNGGIAPWKGLYIPFALLLGFATINIMAKRFRSLGLRGWAAAAGTLGSGVLLGIGVPGPAEIYYALAVVAILSVLPGRHARA